MKILVPVDLNASSLCGFKYAEWLAYELQAELIVLNIIPSGYVSPLELQSRKEEMVIRENKVRKLTREYPDICDSKIGTMKTPVFKVDFGDPVNKILESVKEYNIDLVVMGTRAKHEIYEYIFGSFATELIRKIETPVVIVPEGAPFVSINHIAFAVDINIYQANTDDFVHSFAKKINAKIDLVYVNKWADIEDKSKSVKQKSESLSQKEKINVVNNPSVLEGIDQFIKKNKSNMLAMSIPYRRRAADILSGALSKKLVFQSKIPLLIFH